LTKLRLVTYKELRKLAERSGFEWQRCVGSHNIFKNAEGQIIVIPDPRCTSYRAPFTTQDTA
jgi:predicted RNA binding protein YcfA (HicA-like mRNA interferase family)